MKRHLKLYYIAVVFCLLGVAYVSFSQAVAQESDVYTIADVKADERAENASAARNKAFESAVQLAFTELASRMIPNLNKDEFTPPETVQISPMIRDFQITSEKLSAVRYVASYTFRFKPDAVRAYFSKTAPAEKATRQAPILILPFLQQGYRTILWSDPNPWRQAWWQANQLETKLNYVVPIGDLSDIRDFDETRAMTFTQESLQKLLDRYGADHAALVIADQSKDMQGQISSKTIYIYQTTGASPEFQDAIRIEPVTGETPAISWQRAMVKTLYVIENSWPQNAGGASASEPRRLMLNIQFQSLGEWINLKDRLAQISDFANLNIGRVSPQGATAQVTFQGNDQSLRRVLSQSGLQLVETPYAYEQNPESTYVIRLR